MNPQSLQDILTQALGSTLGAVIINVSDPARSDEAQAWKLIDANGENAACLCDDPECSVNVLIKQLLADPEAMEAHKKEKEAETARKAKADEVLQLLYEITPEYVVSLKGGRYISGLISTGVDKGLEHALENGDVTQPLMRLMTEAIDRSSLANNIGTAVVRALDAQKRRERQERLERRWDHRFSRWWAGTGQYWNTWFELFFNPDPIDNEVAEKIVEEDLQFSRAMADRIANIYNPTSWYRGWRARRFLMGYGSLKDKVARILAENEEKAKRRAEKIEAARPAMRRWLKDQETPGDSLALDALGGARDKLRDEECRKLWEEVLLRFYGHNRQPSEVSHWVRRIYSDIPGDEEEAMVERLVAEGTLIRSDSGDYSLLLSEAERLAAEDAEYEQEKAAKEEARLAQEELVMIKVATGQELTLEEVNLYMYIDDKAVYARLVEQGRLVHNEEHDTYGLPPEETETE